MSHNKNTSIEHILATNEMHNKLCLVCKAYLI